MGLFDELSDADFEVLVADLFSHEMGRRFEAFAPGADGGIDASSVDGQRHVVQCKHYRRSTFSQLKAQAIKQRAKLAAMTHAPARFDFVTSMQLTSRNKDVLVEELRPFVSGHDNIWGYDDVRSLLRQHEQVEKAHVKLWLRSSAQLDRLLNNAAYERTHSLLRQIAAALPRYVQTEAMRQATRLLSKEKVCIIAGPPGVGKTTLAHLLLLQAIEQKLTPFEIVADVEEAWRLHNAAEPQVFFFDDFLGRTRLFDGASSDARSLLRFINEISRSANKRLIITTRLYILQDARRHVEDLSRHNFDAHRFLLTLDKYRPLEKARIFYNHIWASPCLGPEAIAALLQGRGYRRIVDHPGYSPRLIEWMTGLAAHSPTDVEQQHYADYCVGVLDNPTQLWEHAFDQGLDQHAQALLLALASMPRRTLDSDLEQAFDGLCAASGLDGGRQAFAAALRKTEDSFIRLAPAHGQALWASALNPSLLDFLRRYVQDSIRTLTTSVTGAVFFEQLPPLWTAACESGSDVTIRQVVARAGTLLSRAAPTSPPELSSASWSDKAEESRLAVRRLRSLADWVAQAPGIAADVQSLIDNATNGIPDEQLEALADDLLALGRGMVTAKLDFSTVAARFKAKLMPRESKGVREFELLGDIQRLAPNLFAEPEWAVLQDDFTAFAEDVLEDSTAYLDDMQDLDVFEMTASSLDVPLSALGLDIAREAVELKVAEEAAERHQDWEPEPDDDFPRGSRTFSSDTERVDALFERLGDS